MSEASFLTQRCARALEDLENEDIILEMIDEGAELAELLPAFRYAIEIGGEELVRRFIDAGADPQEPLEELEESALCLAARLEFPAVVGVLLELIPSHDRQTLREPLRTAIEHGSHEAAYVLARTMTHEYERRGTRTLALDDAERSAEQAQDFAPLVPVAHHG